MSVNNLSTINQKFIETSKEKVSSQQPQVDLSQKPDSVSFSGKKVARNTGICAIIGAITGKILSKSSKPMKNLIAQSENIKDIAKEKASLEYGKKIADSLEEFWIKGNPTKETVEFLKDLEMDSKYGVFLGDIDAIKRVIDRLRKSSPKSFDEVEKLIFGGELGNEGVKSRSFMSFIQDYDKLLIRYLGGEKELSQEIESRGEFIKQHGNSDFNIKDCINKVLERFYPDEVETFKTTGKVKYHASVASEVSEMTPGLKYKYQEREIFGNIEKQKETELLSNIAKFKNKLTFKYVAIGAAVVSGVALVGSLIYKAVKNKQNVQNK